MKPVCLDGRSLTRAQLVAVAHGAQVELAETQLPAVARAAGFLAEQVRREEPIYGVSTASAATPIACLARTGCAAAPARMRSIRTNPCTKSCSAT